MLFDDCERPRLVCLGESTLVAPSPTENWPAQFGARFPNWNVYNLGVNGQQTQQIDYAAIARPLYNPRASQNVCVLQTLANDLVQSHSDEQIFGDISGIMDAATADGFAAYVCTCPANGFLNEFADGRRLALNAELRIRYKGRVIDMAAPWHRFATIADTAAELGFYYDTAHPTPLGAQGFCDIAAPHIIGSPFSCPSLVLKGEQYIVSLPPQKGFAIAIQQPD